MLHTFEKITANLAGTCRVETLNDREYLVVPLTMIVEGVLNGSDGPLLYPADEIAASVNAWNGIPIVIYHPRKNGKPVSARHPDVLGKSYVGTVFNAQISGSGALVAEGWFDLALTKDRNEDVFNRLDRGEPIELSTGLGLSMQSENGEFNGSSFTSIARNYRPDHLAVLPDQVGACSLDDGCGVGVLNKSFSAIQESLQTQIASKQFGPLEEYRYVRDVNSDGTFIMEKSGKLWKMRYMEDESGVVSVLDNTPEEVQLVTSYVPVQNEKENDMAKLAEKQRKQIIANLVANCDCWKDGEEILGNMTDERLQAFADRFAKMQHDEAVANAARAGFEHGDYRVTFNEENNEFQAEPKKPADPPPTSNQGDPPVAEPKKPQTLAEFMEIAPPEVRDVVNYARQRELEEKEGYIAIITANDSNEFDKKELMDNFNVHQLRKMASLAKKEEAPPATRTLNYRGAAPATTGNSEPEEEALGILSLEDAG